ncbi:MAG: minor capsid protein [Bacteroidales bacterium]|nr:minor capsid protein [Bacteroidales bacterium]
MPELYRLTDWSADGSSDITTLAYTDELSELVNTIAQRIYDGEHITYDPDLLQATVKPYIDGITKGYGKTLADVDWNTPDAKTLQKLTENVFQFSASKDFHILSDMTAALKGADGKMRSFDDFRAEVDKMNVKYNQNWLRTEYNQAVASSQCAARWTDFEKHSKSMPFLQYQAVMDGNTRAEHAALHGVIKRVDSDFWDKYYPPNGWGCRCEVIQLPGKNHKETPAEAIKFCKVDDMWKVNVGKKGVVFPKGHPYFMGQCSTNSCPLKSRKLADGTLKEQCQGCLQGMEKADEYIVKSKKRDWSEFENNNNYKPISGEKNIYAPVGRSSEHDYDDKLTVARTAVEHGYRVWILGKTGEKGERNPDLLFERKGAYRVYDLKRVTSIKSLQQDLIKSEGQAPGALIKINRTGQARTIILAIKKYFEVVTSANEVLIFQGKRIISIQRNFFNKSDFYQRFCSLWKKKGHLIDSGVRCSSSIWIWNARLTKPAGQNCF